MKKFLLALAALSFSLSAFAAGARTKVESHGGHKFDVGACVKVEGDIDHRGEFYVSEMEIKNESRCQK